MKKITLLFLTLAALLSFNVNAQSPKWVFDVAHSNLNFALVRLKVSDVTGSFVVKEATLNVTGEDFQNASAYLVVDVSSIYTSVPDRDHHLQSPDFFDVKQFPDAMFHSTSFKKTGDKKYTVMGDLTMHGITKPATFEVTDNMGFDDHSKKIVTGMKAVGVIKRSDYGLSPNTPTDVLSDEVTLTANLVFVKN